MDAADFLLESEMKFFKDKILSWSSLNKFCFIHSFINISFFLSFWFIQCNNEWMLPEFFLPHYHSYCCFVQVSKPWWYAMNFCMSASYFFTSFLPKKYFQNKEFQKEIRRKVIEKREKKSFKLLVGYIFFIKIKNPNNYRMWLCVWWLWWWLWWKFEYRNNVLYDDDCLAAPLLLMMVIFLSMITVEFFYI